MRSGFIRGVFIGTAIGVVSGVLLNPRTREKAKEYVKEGSGLLKQGGSMLRSAESAFEDTGSFLEKSRSLFQEEDEHSLNRYDSWDTGSNTDNITQRVAYLEQKLGELEHKGV